MRFLDYTPSLLKELNNDSIKFLTLMDSLNDEKRMVISDSLRGHSSIVGVRKKWLLKKLADYGLVLPSDFPLPVIMQSILNVNTLFRLRGSYSGVELFCSLMSLGEVSVDSTNFYTDSACVLLDSILNGFLPTNNVDSIYKLPASTDTLEYPSNITINISSVYFTTENNTLYGASIKEFIESKIRDFLPFTNGDVTINYSTRIEYFFHPLLNERFI